jgi:transcription antitermination factor NusB
MPTADAGRRRSRRKAFELLFELSQHPGLDTSAALERTISDPEVSKHYLHDPDEEGFVSGPLNAAAGQFIVQLVSEVKQHEQHIDSELSRYPMDWSYERIGLPERVILQMAYAEMMYIGTEYRIVINEALELVKLYGEHDAARFINGILGAMLRKHPELEKSGGEEG